MPNGAQVAAAQLALKLSKRLGREPEGWIAEIAAQQPVRQGPASVGSYSFVPSPRESPDMGRHVAGIAQEAVEDPRQAVEDPRRPWFTNIREGEASRRGPVS